MNEPKVVREFGGPYNDARYRVLEDGREQVYMKGKWDICRSSMPTPIGIELARLVAEVEGTEKYAKEKIEHCASWRRVAERLEEEKQVMAERVAELEDPKIQQVYSCGCVECICEEDGSNSCYGCGAKNCGDVGGAECGYSRRLDLQAEITRLRSAAATSIRKCEQYWNEHNIPDAEVHAALELIHGELRKALKGPSRRPNEGLAES